MSNDTDKYQQLIDEAAALVAKVQRDLEATDDVYRSLGLDPAKVASTVEKEISAEQKADADAAFRADMEAIEREVEQEMARRSFSAPASGSSARPRRNMI